MNAYKGGKKMEAKALLFDTRSIQRYIFSGNRLKTNIGASHLVERVFYDVLIKEILIPEFPGDVYAPCMDDEENNDNKNGNKEIVNLKELQKKCTVAYIGGGNALIIFRMDTEDDIQKKIVMKFSKHLLVSHPGLHIGAAFGRLDISSSESIQQGIDKLYEKLKKNQATVFPQVNVPYTGLTLTCKVNGETANYYDTKKDMGKSDDKDNETRFFSREAVAKTKAATLANKKLRHKVESLFVDLKDYEFPQALDELGQKRNESRSNYIAIVHLDGNNMGRKFRLLCKDLNDRSSLAEDIRNKTEGSFAILLNTIIDQCERKIYEDELDLIPKKDSSIPKGKKILPIRPLILGGDDVTFICPAKVAVVFTKRLMEILLAEPPKDGKEIKDEIARRVDSCAGIAILPTSYPFFRGYKLAEQLCDNAKQRMRSLLPEIQKEKEAHIEAEDLFGTSWLDFAILHGEQAPTLEQIREREYSGMRGDMHFGPYQVGNDHAKQNEDCNHNIENLLDCVHQLQIGSKENNEDISALPISKIKEMRNVLQQGEAEAARFVDQMNRLGQKLPHIEVWKQYEKSLWSNGETPYVDAIEMMDFIPEGV